MSLNYQNVIYYYNVQSITVTKNDLCSSCFVVLFFCLSGGLLAGSLAVMTDAAHMLSDFAAFLISLFAIWVAHWLPDKKRTFGYYRAGELCIKTTVLSSHETLCCYL